MAIENPADPVAADAARLASRYEDANEVLADRVASRLSHDLNNQIQGVLGFADLIDVALPADSPLRVSLGRVMEAGERAAALLRALTDYRHLRTRAPRSLDLNRLVEKALTLFGDAPARGLALDFSPAPDLPQVTGLAEHWLGALLAALTAAEDGARPTRIEIRTRRAEDPRRPVELTLRHTGCGPLADATSTPDGNDFGLWMALDVAQACGGEWTAVFSPARGTEYKWSLPSSSAPGASAATGGARASAPRRALIVENNAIVGDLLQRVLCQLGFGIELRPDAGAACACWQEQPAPAFGLALLDWEGPGMTAPAFFARLRAAEPALPILILTDYGWLEDELELPPGAPVRILSKPFSPRDLIASVEALAP